MVTTFFGRSWVRLCVRFCGLSTAVRQEEALRVASGYLKGVSGRCTTSAKMGPLQSELSRASRIWHLTLSFHM